MSHRDYATRKPRHIIRTGHSANIFGVAFLPCSSNNFIVSAAMDKEVRLHNIEKTQTTVWRCHRDRVKTVAVEPGNPNLYFSASEDGTCRQWDLRVKHVCGPGQCNNAIFDLRKSRQGRASAGCSSSWSGGWEGDIEFKGLSVNPTFPLEIATASSDPFVRIFDRRRLGNSSPHSPAIPCFQRFAPGFLISFFNSPFFPPHFSKQQDIWQAGDIDQKSNDFSLLL